MTSGQSTLLTGSEIDAGGCDLYPSPAYNDLRSLQSNPIGLSIRYATFAIIKLNPDTNLQGTMLIAPNSVDDYAL
ncbi:hypothetical protein TWF106_009523 [Orbilia oligospora]|uniref:Uncharacterized protein n=1 Tax=Orbilia oligospora TaxID=2813651 RepID=A0A6G1ML43_ORBOL|nr:hypothetical protein TWF788_004560 [Orbilia oligospora]KAF3202619.1 hypothetical protein TWF679_010713 [Orbilia oligospora]KAF3213396.1 hypothetical protein TWF106_009523 [Orbilia oligospora]KAF3229966.1 hypothetical protein TWF191_000869 [Orbilia oligospora]KAF3260604.1 hypothetical protein TWF192_009885 [Orbilia oligospora]